MKHEIEIINKAHKITDYLSLHGVQPASFDGERYKYNCPLPRHKKDKTPSFIVFNKNGTQDFCCFGCKSGGGIIQLVSAFEEISLQDSLKKLSEGLNIKVDDVIDALVRDLTIYIDKDTDDEKTEALQANALFISTHMYSFLNKVDFNEQDLSIAEKVFKIVDSLLYIENLDDMEKLAKNITKKTKQRYAEYIQTKKKNEIENLIKSRKVNEML